MRKTLLMIFLAGMAAVLLLGCGRSPSKGGVGAIKRDSSEVIDPLNQAEKMSLKVATLTGYTRSGSRTQKWLEERYNISMEILPLPGAADVGAKVSLLMADDNERPDIIWWQGMDADFAKWKEAGLLVDLTDYLNKYTEMRDYYNSQDPRILFYAASDGNRIYRIPGDVSEPSSTTLWIRKDWLDNLGLPIPKTLTEFEDALYKFTRNDPDRNGKNDTYGFAGGNNSLVVFWPWIQGSGTGRGKPDSFTVMPDGTYAYTGAIEDTRIWLDRVAKLYREGIITPNSVISNTNLADELARGGFGSTYRWVAWNNPSAVAMKSFYASNPNAKWLPIEVVAGDNGHPQDDPAQLSAWCHFAITKNAKDPERIFAIWDDMAKPEPYITKRFGIEGQEWERNPDGSVRILVSSGSAENQEKNIGIDLFHDIFARKDQCNISNTAETVALFQRSAAMSRDVYNLLIEKKNPSQYVQWREYGSEIQDVMNAYLWSVIGGTRSVNEWDKYLADLETAGLSKVLAELAALYPKQKQEMDTFLTAYAARAGR